MKGTIQVALVAALIVGVVAQPHQHQHQHRHFHDKKHELDRSPAEKRGTSVTITSVVAGPTMVKYVLDDALLNNKAAEEGLAKGLYIIIGESTPTPVESSTSTTSTTSSSSSSKQAAQFFEHKSSTTASPKSKPSPTASPAAAAGLNADFPNASIKCSQFPDDYGALPVKWLNNDGWTSIQVPNVFEPGVAIQNIVAPTSGGCTKGALCSYACPPGYQKTQWPVTSQGASGQSVGGLYCNSDGFLELTRPSHPRLCESGAGGVFIKNNLSGSAAVCRTDYPASENMVIPLNTSPGGVYPLTNPSSETYYSWQGKATTAQYYVNNLNVALEDACVWTSPKYPDSAGNWAPLNIGTGQADDGMTYVSLFPNLPTSTAVLDFNVEITGDANAPCWFRNGQYYGGGNGCTTAFARGGKVTITFSN